MRRSVWFGNKVLFRSTKEAQRFQLIKQGMNYPQSFPFSSSTSPSDSNTNNNNSKGNSSSSNTSSKVSSNMFSEIRSRRLEDVVMIDKMKLLSPEAIKEIWRVYHAEEKIKSRGIYATTCLPEVGLLIHQRGATYPIFVLPRFLNKVNFFTMFCQYIPDERTCYFTYLEDYKKNPKTAQPWMSLQLFSQFPQICLIQTNHCQYLRNEDARDLTNSWLGLYGGGEDQFERVVGTFTKFPAKFDFNAVFKNPYNK